MAGLAPAIQATRPALTPALGHRAPGETPVRFRSALPRLRLTQVLVVAQIASSLGMDANGALAHLAEHLPMLAGKQA